MHRLVALAFAVVLLAGASAPLPVEGSATGVLPPESAVVAPLPWTTGQAPAPDSLRKIGTLRIRALGISKTVYDWGCRKAVVPDPVLQWGCTPTRNRFLVGHAYGVFHPYYLAYKAHRLTVGMVATLTSPTGKVTSYRLAWVRKVPSTYIWNGQTGEQWAWSNTPVPSLTLQTCYGATNAYRIVSRWVKA